MPKLSSSLTCDSSSLHLQDKADRSPHNRNSSGTASFWAAEPIVPVLHQNSALLPLNKPTMAALPANLPAPLNHYSDYGWPSQEESLNELERYLGVEKQKDSDEEIDVVGTDDDEITEEESSVEIIRNEGTVPEEELVQNQNAEEEEIELIDEFSVVMINNGNTSTDEEEVEEEHELIEEEEGEFTEEFTVEIIEPITEIVECDEDEVIEDEYSVEVEEDEERCVTPEADLADMNRLNCLNRLHTTARARYVAHEVNELEPRGEEEYLFTGVHDEHSFELIAPFDEEPMCETIHFPVNEDQMDFLCHMLDNFDPSMVADEEGFEKFARDLEWRGTDYRGMLLRQLAYKRVHGVEQVMEATPEDFVDHEYQRSLMHKQWIRDRRRARADANALEGFTPTGRRLERIPRRLFADEDCESPIKRRRLEFDD